MSEQSWLVRRRTLWLPTIWGWLLLLALAAGVVWWVLPRSYSFLAVTDDVRGGPVIVEGWASTNVMRTAIKEFGVHDYPSLLITGGRIEDDSPVRGQGTYAELGKTKAKLLGLREEAARPIPAVPVQRDRTYASALALRRWFEAQGSLPAQLTLVSSGPHARRSRLMFQDAFGTGTQVAVVSVVEGSYDPPHWWKTSTGFRDVTSEFIAYLYARVLFSHSE